MRGAESRLQEQPAAAALTLLVAEDSTERRQAWRATVNYAVHDPVQPLTPGILRLTLFARREPFCARRLIGQAAEDRGQQIARGRVHAETLMGSLDDPL